MADDKIQHGIDDDPNNDPHKAKNLGGAGGAVTGAIAGSAAGPLGTVAGAVIGGVAGAVASKEAVKVIDAHDNDNTITGLGHGATTDVNHPDYVAPTTYGTTTTDTRGVVEKIADKLTGDHIDDKTGKTV